MKSRVGKTRPLPLHLIMVALALAVSIQDTDASDLEIVKKYSEADSVAKVVFLESKPNQMTQASNIIEKLTQTFDPGDQIEVTLTGQATDRPDPVRQEMMKRWEAEANLISQQRKVARERLSRASEEIARGNLTTQSKYYRDLLGTYMQLDDRYNQILENLKPTPRPIKRILTVQSRDQILRDLKSNHSSNRSILMIRRISVKDLAKGAAGFAITVGAVGQVMAAENAAKKAEALPRVVQPMSYQNATGVN